VAWFETKRQERIAAQKDEAVAEADIIMEASRRAADEAGGGDGGDGGDGSDGEAADRDKLFRQAAEICIQSEGGSTSLLQRRLKIGYGRAARLIDQIEDAGVLGPSDGPRGRDVLMGLDELARFGN